MTEKKYTYSKLRGRIVEKYGTITAFSKDVGMTTTSIYFKLSGKVPFNQRDVEKWCNLLSIKVSEIGAYFFT